MVSPLGCRAHETPSHVAAYHGRGYDRMHLRRCRIHAECKCVFYTGSAPARKEMWKDQVDSMCFNVLVTTYEFAMRDVNALSKLQWKYLVIDEAQRMKDRESKLAKAIDKISFERRLLLTGTPLQNELRELWSLLNLLLPQLFNDRAQFAAWFGDALAKGKAEGEDDLIANEKRVVVVNRCAPQRALL